MLRIGFHTSIVNGFFEAVKSVEVLNANSVQVFCSNPLSFVKKSVPEEKILMAREEIVKNDISFIIHSSYLLNFCKDFYKNKRSFSNIIFDMNCAVQIGAKGVVLHTGKELNIGYERALKNLVNSIITILNRTNSKSILLLENTAGQGTEIGYSIEELSKIYHLLPIEYRERVGFCFDTAHGFAAGIDFSSKSGVKDFYNKFERLIGWEKIKCFHLNDSKKGLGSKVDRHEDIGYGKMGVEGLKELVNICVRTDKPMILETPCNFINYNEQIKIVKSWVE